MSDSSVKSYAFDKLGIASLGSEEKELNWPVVYQIYNRSDLYVGETTNLKNRMQQHFKAPDKVDLQKFNVVYNNAFNKSVALDLESQLIQWFSGDGKFRMKN